MKYINIVLAVLFTIGIAKLDDYTKPVYIDTSSFVTYKDFNSLIEKVYVNEKRLERVEEGDKREKTKIIKEVVRENSTPYYRDDKREIINAIRRYNN